MDDQLSQLLNADDKIDELTDDQLKDVWVRGKFMREIFGAQVRQGPPPLTGGDPLEWHKEMLAEGPNSGLKEVAIDVTGTREAGLASRLGWENGPGNVETLFERWTKDDHPEPMKALRASIKSRLRGSGMPDMNVMRKRIDHHLEGDTQ